MINGHFNKYRLSKAILIAFLGDGEFDGIELQAALQGENWRCVCRTARNPQFFEEGRSCSFPDLCLAVDDQIGLLKVWFTKEGYDLIRLSRELYEDRSGEKL